MKRPNYESFFEDWEIGLAIKVIGEFKKKWKFLENEDEDLLQECLIQWSFYKDKYNSACGASKGTFMAQVVKAKLQIIIRKYGRNNRKVIQSIISFDDPVSEKHEDLTLHDVLPDKTDYNVQSELKITLSKTLTKLTHQQQILCKLLINGVSNIDELRKILKVGRATVYREIKRVKDVFEKEGLKEFLK